MRWVVGPKPHNKTYSTKALADSRRSDLVTAAKRIEGQDAQSRKLIEGALGEPRQGKPYDEMEHQEDPEAARERDGYEA